MFERLGTSTITSSTATSGTMPAAARFISLPGTLLKLDGTGDGVAFSQNSAAASASAARNVAPDQLQDLQLNTQRLLSFSHPDHGSLLVDLDTSRVFSLNDQSILRCVLDPSSPHAFALPEVKNLRVEVVHQEAIGHEDKDGSRNVLLTNLAIGAATLAIVGSAVTTFLPTNRGGTSTTPETLVEPEAPSEASTPVVEPMPVTPPVTVQPILPPEVQAPEAPAAEAAAPEQSTAPIVAEVEAPSTEATTPSPVEAPCPQVGHPVTPPPQEPTTAPVQPEPSERIPEIDTIITSPTPCESPAPIAVEVPTPSEAPPTVPEAAVEAPSPVTSDKRGRSYRRLAVPLASDLADLFPPVAASPCNAVSPTLQDVGMPLLTVPVPEWAEDIFGSLPQGDVLDSSHGIPRASIDRLTIPLPAWGMELFGTPAQVATGRATLKPKTPSLWGQRAGVGFPILFPGAFESGGSGNSLFAAPLAAPGLTSD